MNEEEKKAIESFKDDLNKCKNELILCRQGLLDLKTILNLIEKLQKENEELKEYIATAPNSDEMTATKYRNIQQDAYIQGRAEEQKKQNK